MEGFAKAMGATVINCTPHSLVDAYERDRTSILNL